MKAVIKIITKDGNRFLYVNPAVSENFYQYSGETGEQLEDQTAPGEILSDYNALMTDINTGGALDEITFPDGNNYIEKRNFNQPGQRDIPTQPRVRVKILKQSVSFVLIEEMLEGLPHDYLI